MRKFLFNLKKINIQLFLIFLLILIFSKQTEFFKNFYDLIYKSHNLRQQEANDFCNYFGTGYIFYIKKKFNLKKAPRIKNFVKSPEQYWIFSENYKSIDEKKLIILNKNKNFKIEKDNFKVLDNFDDKCYLLEKI